MGQVDGVLFLDGMALDIFPIWVEKPFWIEVHFNSVLMRFADTFDQFPMYVDEHFWIEVHFTSVDPKF